MSVSAATKSISVVDLLMKTLQTVESAFEEVFEIIHGEEDAQEMKDLKDKCVSRMKETMDKTSSPEFRRSVEDKIKSISRKTKSHFDGGFAKGDSVLSDEPGLRCFRKRSRARLVRSRV